jgi:hypothetical protein
MRFSAFPETRFNPGTKDIGDIEISQDWMVQKFLEVHELPEVWVVG